MATATTQITSFRPESILPTSEYDRASVDAVLNVRPVWRRDGTAGDLIGLSPHRLLHAGPPFRVPHAVPRPVLNSACVAAVFEGIATDFANAREKIGAGDILLEPAQNFGVVTPLATVVSSSMWLHEIVDWSNGDAPLNHAYAPFNCGVGAAPRLGRLGMDVVNHVRWLNNVLARELRQARPEEVDLLAVADLALARGDDLHGRTAEATCELLARLKPSLGPETSAFLRSSPSFFLNLWMAACKCMLMAAEGQAGSSMLIAAGANGEDFGIKVGGIPDTWFCAPSTVPRGDFGAWPQQRGLPAVGDSAIVEAAGFGAMAIAHAPLSYEALGAFMPRDGLFRPAQIFATRHRSFNKVSVYTGLCARRALAIGKTPLISLGVLDVNGEEGRLGGGIFEPSMVPFRDAAAALRERAPTAAAVDTRH